MKCPLPLFPGNVCRRDMVQSSHGAPLVSREHRINTITNTTQAISVYPSIVYSSCNISVYLSISQYIPAYLSISQYIPAYLSISQYISVYPSISQYISVNPSISQYSPVYPSMSQYSPAYLSISQHISV